MTTIDDLWVAGQEFQRPNADDTSPGGTASPLLAALLGEDQDAVQALLVAGIPIGLREAAMLGDAPTVRRLLAAGVDPIPELGWGAIHLAAWAGRTSVIAILLDAGVPVDLPARGRDTIFGCTPLHLATIQGHGAAMQQLLDAGADPSKRDDAGFSPLHQAAERGDLPAVKRLVVAGAEINGLCGDTTPLGLAMREGHGAVVSLLRQVGGTD